MTIKPILFSGAMVRALLEGRKSQTRRVLKPQAGEAQSDPNLRSAALRGRIRAVKRTRTGKKTAQQQNYRVGDLLWVRESISFSAEQGHFCFAADGKGCGLEAFSRKLTHRSRPSIHMPRWLSRITLEVTNVRIERLQDISREDAAAEGMTLPSDADRSNPDLPIERYRALWDRLNAKRGFDWSGNPQVIAISFKVHLLNVDELRDVA